MRDNMQWLKGVNDSLFSHHAYTMITAAHDDDSLVREDVGGGGRPRAASPRGRARAARVQQHQRRECRHRPAAAVCVRWRVEIGPGKGCTRAVEGEV